MTYGHVQYITYAQKKDTYCDYVQFIGILGIYLQSVNCCHLIKKIELWCVCVCVCVCLCVYLCVCVCVCVCACTVLSVSDERQAGSHHLKTPSWWNNSEQRESLLLQVSRFGARCPVDYKIMTTCSCSHVKDLAENRPCSSIITIVCFIMSQQLSWDMLGQLGQMCVILA